MKKAIEHLSKDLLLRGIIHSVDLPKITDKSDIYNALIKAIVSQQLSVKSAAAIYLRFCRFFDETGLTPLAVKAASIEALRGLGLSAQKAQYVKNVADFYIEKKLDKKDWTAMSDREIIDLLTEIKGVGEWTVQMLLMFNLERLDVFPTKDLGIQMAMKKLYKLDLEKKPLIEKMESISEPWKPYRTLAARYLWAYKDN